MINDWNWFYSSVAQSAAAIVGIFAAFIITKIINNQLEYNKLMRYSGNLIMKSEKLIEKTRSTRIAWYNDTIFKIETLKMIEALRNRTIDQPEQYQYLWKFSPFAPKWHMEQKLDEFFRGYKQKCATTGMSLKELLLGSSSGGLLIVHYEQLVKEERDIINSLITDIRYNIREIKSLLEEISKNPQSSKLVTFSIIGTVLMFVIGVIYPLNLLPINGILKNYSSELIFNMHVYNSNIKFIVIGSIFIIFITIMTVFMVVNIKLKFPVDIMSKLHTYSVMESYSEYFKDIDEKFTLR